MEFSIYYLDSQNMYMYITSVSISLFMGLYLLALFYKNTLKDEEESPEKEISLTELEKKKLYYYKYQEEFDKLELCDVNKNLDLIFLKEKTDSDDLIIMGYNKLKDCFDVWFDNKNVQFMELDTVAQLYAIVFDCKKLCVNYKLEIERSKSEINVAKEKTCEADDVFVKFKKYNKKKSFNSKGVPEHSNKFHHCGKICHWTELYENHGEWKESDISKNVFTWEKKKMAIDKTPNNISWQEWKKNNNK